MVAPLNIVVAHGVQHIENLAGSRAAVENISYDVQFVDRQAMDKIRDGNDQLVGTTGFDDGIDDGVVIRLAVFLLHVRFVQQLGDDIFVSGGQEPAHLAAAVFDGHRACYVHHLVQPPLVPFPQGGQVRDLRIEPEERFVFFRFSPFRGLWGFIVPLDEFDPLVGVVDQRAEGAFLLFRQAVSIDLIDLFAHHARGVLDHVYERQRRAVQVAHKMLCSFRQGEYRPQVDQLCDDRLCVRKLIAQ